MEWFPAASELEVSVAVPDPLSGDEPITEPPSLKVTVPVGLLPTPVTVAVKTTGAPAAAGFGATFNAVVLDACPDIWFTTGEVLLAKLLSPP